MQSQCKPALDLIEKVPANAVPGWQIAELRGRALIGLEKWDDAAKVLPGALTLNPHPDEAHYLLGVVYEQQKEFAKAAAEYRQAFESTSAGPNLKIK
jgi:Flp pilus assembly protein TadD